MGSSTNDEPADPDKSPHRRIKGPRKTKGLVIVNTGDGKGQISTALRVLFRARGRDMRVGMRQFLKHTGAQFGEHRAAKKLDIDLQAMGDGFTWLSKDMDRTMALASTSLIEPLSQMLQD